MHECEQWRIGIVEDEGERLGPARHATEVERGRDVLTVPSVLNRNRAAVRPCRRPDDESHGRRSSERARKDTSIRRLHRFVVADNPTALGPEESAYDATPGVIVLSEIEPSVCGESPDLKSEDTAARVKHSSGGRSNCLLHQLEREVDIPAVG